MVHAFFERHAALLGKAVQATAERTFWSPYPEVPSQKIYGEGSADAGKQAFDSYLEKEFVLEQAGCSGTTGNEVSPYGFALGIRYPKVDKDAMFAAVSTAHQAWRRAGRKAWAGVCLEILDRLNKRSFEIGHATMHTTGQGFAMAFQAGGPHAQDRGLEAVAYAWQAMADIPEEVLWEKPQGKHAPLVMQKQYRIAPRGIGLVIGCCTFPTWNSYAGIFANLATGNAVVVKPHPGAILPLAITVKIAREVIAEAGLDPNVIMLAAHEAKDNLGRELVVHPAVKIIDYTGSAENGNWIEANARHAQVYAEKSGINQIILDSTDDFAGMARNIAFSLCLYSGQMCTAPQNIFIPRDGIQTENGHCSFDEVVNAIRRAIEDLTEDPARAVELLGALQNSAILSRADRIGGEGKVVLPSRTIEHPSYAQAHVQTPVVLQLDAEQEKIYMRECFGPVFFVVTTDDTRSSMAIAEKAVRLHGGMTLSLYSTNDTIIADVCDMADAVGVALSINLTGGIFVNQSAAFSDFHGTGANPAASCAMTDLAFVARRFTVSQNRTPIRN